MTAWLLAKTTTTVSLQNYGMNVGTCVSTSLALYRIVVELAYLSRGQGSFLLFFQGSRDAPLSLFVR
jgi:hypothetical protein